MMRLCLQSVKTPVPLYGLTLNGRSRIPRPPASVQRCSTDGLGSAPGSGSSESRCAKRHVCKLMATCRCRMQVSVVPQQPSYPYSDPALMIGSLRPIICQKLRCCPQDPSSTVRCCGTLCCNAVGCHHGDERASAHKDARCAVLCQGLRYAHTTSASSWPLSTVLTCLTRVLAIFEFIFVLDMMHQLTLRLRSYAAICAIPVYRAVHLDLRERHSSQHHSSSRI
jgi:hypothetical protein